ncbi:MAG: helix-turn-helix transcriptional regulator [Verrucomicrobia bacterium]|nr:helix-turn-helix transcriptional regulator [Verrucomicrobiota bacterium]
MSRFGQYLTSKLREHGISQSQLSYRSGISDAHISRLSKEERGLPKIETLCKIAKALNISLRQMLRDLGYLEPEVDELPDNLRGFLRSTQCPPDVSVDEVEALASHSNYEGSEATPEGYKKILEEIRHRPTSRIQQALEGQDAKIQEAVARMVEAYVKAFGDALDSGEIEADSQ